MLFFNILLLLIYLFSVYFTKHSFIKNFVVGLEAWRESRQPYGRSPP